MTTPNDSDAHRLRHIAEVVGGSDELALRRLIESDPLVHRLVTIGREPPSGMIGAALAVTDLRQALRSIRERHPAYAPGHEPTAEDHLGQVLQLMEFGIRQVSLYLGVAL